MKCEWFDKHVKRFNEIIPFPEEFDEYHVPEKYKNIVSELFKITNNYRFNDFDECEKVDKFLLTHKYKINFSNEQHLKLQKYFIECTRLYNFCVDIWTDYNEMTTCWQIVKDSIFDHLYRFKNDDQDLKEVRSKVIEDLKKRRQEFDLENQKNQELINKQKEINKQKFNKEMEEYKKLLKENKNNTIKNKLKKPKLEKIKIKKIEKPRKENRCRIKKPAPDATLVDEIREFCKNLQNARDSIFGTKDASFTMKHKNISISQTISVSKKAVSDKGLFVRELKDINCQNYEKIIKKYKINHDCELNYDFLLGNYYFLVVFEQEQKVITKKRNEIGALDPGEKTFITYYSINENGKIGDNMKIEIKKWLKKIGKLQSILDKGKNKKKKKLTKKEIKKLRKKIRRYNLRIKGYVNEIHKKGAKYLCETFENIFLPEFKTKPMISKNKIKQKKNMKK